MAQREMTTTTPGTPEREALEAFIRRAGFNFGWDNLELQARRIAEYAVTELAASPAAGGVQAPEAWIDAVMEQAQVFASAWSLVGSRFDAGQGHEDALAAKAELRAMLAATPPAAPAQAMPAPSIPESVLAYIHAYGDARADDDATSPVRLAESILAIRRWAATLVSQEGAANHD